MKKIFFYLFGMFPLLALPLMAEVTVQSDGHELRFTNADYEARFIKGNLQTGAPYAWTLATLKYQNRDLVIETGAHGAVMQLKSDVPLPEGGFVGSRHGGEDIRRIVVIVDGKEHSPEQPLSVSGTQVELLKESVVGPYEYTSRVRLDDEGLHEEGAFKATGDTSSVACFYPFMHCLSKSFTEWITGSATEELAAGKFKVDDSFTDLGRLEWVGVFSESKGYGAVISYAEDYAGAGSGKLTHRFWNRLRDNKLYFWPNLPTENSAHFACRVTGFTAEAGDWKQKAQTLSGKQP